MAGEMMHRPAPSHSLELGLFPVAPPVTFPAFRPVERLISQEFCGPVIDFNFADPSVIRIGDRLWSFATQSDTLRKDETELPHLQGAWSVDGIHWNYVGNVLPEQPGMARGTRNSWAPEPAFIKGKLLGVYSSYDKYKVFGPSVFLCTINTETGIWTPVDDAPLLEARNTPSPYFPEGNLGCDVIDPKLYEDDDGEVFLFYGGGHSSPVKVSRMSRDGLSVVEGTEKELVFPEHEVPLRWWYEASQIVKGVDGTYHLLLSGDNCFERYGVTEFKLERYTDSTIGETFRVAERVGRVERPVLQANEKVFCVGQPSIFSDDEGKRWAVYHGIDRQNPKDAQGNWIRAMYLDRVHEDAIGLLIGDGSPTLGFQTGPALAGIHHTR